MKNLFRYFCMAFAMTAVLSCGKEDPVTPDDGGDDPTPTPIVVKNYIKLAESGHSVSVKKVSNYEFEISVTGTDPYLMSSKLNKNYGEDYRILEFEYKTSSGISGENGFQIFYAVNSAPAEASSAKYGDLSATSSYKKFTADVTKFRRAGWGKSNDCLRFDLGGTSGQKITIRNIELRKMTDEELANSEEADRIEMEKQQMAENIDNYLSKTYPSSVSKVTVTADKVTVEGKTGGSGSYVLADICPWQDVTEMTEYPYTDAIEGTDFKITLDRKVNGREGIIYDRVFSKWAVVKVDGDKQTLDSHARYADEVAPKASPVLVPLKNKKGFGAGGGSTYFSDCDEMNIGSITMNVLLHGFINGTGSDFTYGGIGYKIGAGYRSSIDATVAETQKRGIIVSAIILCAKNSSYVDPENMGGYYSMPNLTTAEAFNMYAAALEYMASRYSQDSPGRIHHWIMHNEVDMGKDWTNMGDQPLMRYLDRYVKSMRICYNIVRQYDQNASILGSYTHNWVQADGGYSPKEMLNKTVEYSNAEGDFRWGVAYHPYPIDLTKPEFWKNDVNAATYDMNSPYCTFRNLEVIDHWIKQKENLYKGETKRVLFLSEQGTNSPTYSDNDLRLQAAGGAWAWKKAAKLDGIDAIQWHNWADNKQEFGLRIGLRSFEDETMANLTPKPVWYVWKDAGTDKESERFDPYMSTLGISSWDAIMGTIK